MNWINFLAELDHIFNGMTVTGEEKPVLIHDATNQRYLKVVSVDWNKKERNYVITVD